MEHEQYLESLARDSDALADAAAAAGPDTTVPTCPGWTVEDLLRHCASGDRWARVIVETGSREHAPRDLPPDAPSGAGLVPYFRGGPPALASCAARRPGGRVWFPTSAAAPARSSTR